MKPHTHQPDEEVTLFDLKPPVTWLDVDLDDGRILIDVELYDHPAGQLHIQPESYQVVMLQLFANREIGYIQNGVYSFDSDTVPEICISAYGDIHHPTRL